MKLKFLAIAVLSLVCATFTGCSKSGADAAKDLVEKINKVESADDANALVDDYVALMDECTELSEKAIGGDADAAAELAKIQDELQKANQTEFVSKLSAENLARIQQAAQKMYDKAMKQAGDVMQQAGSDMEEFMNSDDSEDADDAEEAVSMSDDEE
jgi:hypothetical protein